MITAAERDFRLFQRVYSKANVFSFFLHWLCLKGSSNTNTYFLPQWSFTVTMTQKYVSDFLMDFIGCWRCNGGILKKSLLL